MSSNWIILVSLCLLLCAEANAQQAPAAGQEEANAANKEQALKGGRLSPRQRAELTKAAAADQNTQAGTAFLNANKVKPGVISLPSGVQYKVLKPGSGNRPGDAGSVLVRYQGTLIDGSSFDKVDDKSPIPLRVFGLVPGLREAVKLMPVGSKWEIVVPPQLGYGAQGYRGVGPNAVLIYVLEIVGLN
jgi:FKBP-type peptidyl-prolyl cis-trans isomerase FklB